MLHTDPIPFEGVPHVNKYRPKADAFYVKMDELPPAPEADAFDRVAMAFDGFLSEETIDTLPDTERNYWAALLTVVAALAVNGADGERSLLGTAEIRDLHDSVLRQPEQAIGLLQDFGGFIVKQGQARTKAFRDSLPSDSSHRYAIMSRLFNNERAQQGLPTF